ncbi:MAG: hypothetical protein M3O36_15390 [Myxococcota bacterium]|nr:hypothetical protein [Myxococcota bacterium]
MKRSCREATAAVGMLMALFGCSSSGSATDGSLPFRGSNGSSSGSSQGPSAGGAFATADAGGGLPAEVKTESDYQSPVATGNTVWIANPRSGRVAYVDATSFNVQTVQAGDGPTYLAAVPNLDPSATSEAAIVINVRSHDATLLRHDTLNGRLSPTTYPSTGDANAWAISPSGRWAVAWTDAARLANTDPTQGFQDIAVLDLTSGPALDAGTPILAVGYRPSQVVFAQHETRAFVVTQDGISVIELGSRPAVTHNFALAAPVPLGPAVADAASPDSSAVDAMPTDASAVDAATEGSVADASPEGMAAGDGPLEVASDGSSSALPIPAPGGTPDVSFSPDGTVALVRQDGVAAITVISLTDGSPTRVALPSPPTDLTISPDGSFAVAVLRNTSTVAILPLPGITSDPTASTLIGIAGEIVGRAVVTASSKQQPSVLLFTTAAAVPRLTVLTLQPRPSYRTIALHAPVRAVFPTGDGNNAIVLHALNQPFGSGSVPTPSSLASSVRGAFSIVPISQDLPPKIVSLTAPPTAVALAPAGDRALVMVSDDASIFGVELVKMPSLEVVPYSLASPPTAVGIAAGAGKGFVAQNYADGRITLIDLAGGAARTITGFELGARVVQGVKP